MAGILTPSFYIYYLKQFNKPFHSIKINPPDPLLSFFFIIYFFYLHLKFTVTIYNYPQLLTMINYDKHD